MSVVCKDPIGSPESAQLDHDLSADELRAYGIALQLLALAFRQAPNADFLRGLAEGDPLADWPLQPLPLAAEDGTAGIRSMSAGADLAALSQSLYEEHIYLFIGPGRVRVPPWESVYLSQDHLLFDEQTVAVRRAYAAFGLQAPRMDKEPDDHMALELLFLSLLMQRAGDALEDGRTDDVERYLTSALDFLRGHPRQWAHLFVERLHEHARLAYYPGWGDLLLGSLDTLEARLAQAAAGEL